MEIGPLRNYKPPPVADQPVTEQKTKGAEKAQLCDSVELSHDARQKLAEMADAVRVTYGLGEMPPQDEGETGGNLRTDRIFLARQRINQGYYDQPHIRFGIAEKLADEVINLSQTDFE